MQRLRKERPERGAIAVIVALVMVGLMATAALAIDVSAIYVDRQQLQTGADAAALAVAQDCARDRCGDDETLATAQSMARSNINDGDATGTVPKIDKVAGTVTIHNSTVRKHAFAPIIGVDETEITAWSNARWGYPTGGTAVLPLAFSWCELLAQTGITVIRDSVTNEVIGVDIPATTPEHTIYFTKSSGTNCTGPSGNLIPAGFGWLTPSATQCGKTESIIDGWVGSDTGNNVPGICSPADFQKWIGKTVLLPIFDEYKGTGSGGEYKVFGYAAFTLKSYYFAGSYKPVGAPCGGDARCVSGSFDRFVDLNENFDYSPTGPKLGAAVVALTQ